ncbi:hypothetical protein Bbelb_355270 [Branchiostoma belcheri]|nr:hypothetical protein Bbelb_355270 [Branchiostoma belcheri]
MCVGLPGVGGGRRGLTRGKWKDDCVKPETRCFLACQDVWVWRRRNPSSLYQSSSAVEHIAVPAGGIALAPRVNIYPSPSNQDRDRYVQMSSGYSRSLCIIFSREVTTTDEK